MFQTLVKLLVTFVVTFDIVQQADNLRFSQAHTLRKFDSFSRRSNEDVDPETRFNTDDFIRNLGYPVENHTVTTEDGYVLQIFRIPFGKNDVGDKDLRPPVLVQHGLLCSSDDWVMNGENQSLAYMLADAGFDVWLGNIRGNKYSLRHTAPAPSHHDFFQFSWDDMAEYDVPAIIDYVLNVTGYENLQYIGHSMGTTMCFAMLSTKTEYNAKVRHFHALGPVATVNKVRTPLKMLAPFVDEIEFVFDLIGYDDFLPSDKLIKMLAPGCVSLIETLCENVLFVLCGYDLQELNITRLPVYISHTPAGTSSMSVFHYVQMINSGYFRRYDYGFIKNYEKYGQFTPPKYDVKKVSSPVSLYWAQNDLLADPSDVQELYHSLNNCVEIRQIGGPSYSHLDFTWAVDNGILLNDYLISVLEKY